jgi:hypothetical protein
MAVVDYTSGNLVIVPSLFGRERMSKIVVPVERILNLSRLADPNE